MVRNTDRSPNPSQLPPIVYIGWVSPFPLLLFLFRPGTRQDFLAMLSGP